MKEWNWPTHQKLAHQQQYKCFILRVPSQNGASLYHAWDTPFWSETLDLYQWTLTSASLDFMTDSLYTPTREWKDKGKTDKLQWYGVKGQCRDECWRWGNHFTLASCLKGFADKGGEKLGYLPKPHNQLQKGRLLCVGCLTSQQHASVSQGRGRGGGKSAQTILSAATLRQKLQIKLSISPSHSIPTLGQPVPALTL